jgi:hypothetical protein
VAERAIGAQRVIAGLPTSIQEHRVVNESDEDEDDRKRRIGRTLERRLRLGASGEPPYKGEETGIIDVVATPVAAAREADG